MDQFTGNFEDLEREGAAAAAQQGIDSQSYKEMCKMMSQVKKDPAMRKQMEGYWKMLDNMHKDDPKEYSDFIKTQMDDMKVDQGKTREERDKKFIVESSSFFCFTVRPARFEKVKSAEEDMQEKAKAPEVKLFDFGAADIKENVPEYDDKKEPLESPKCILNLVHNDVILPPLNKDRDIADPLNDKEWMLIPISFDGPVKRKAMSGTECWHYDGHINTCVVTLMQKESSQFNAILNYFVQKFIAHLKTTEGYIVHKKSIKLCKDKRYKDSKTGAFQGKTQPYKLPLHLRKEAYIESKNDYLEKKKKAEEANGGKPVDITLADIAKKASGQSNQSEEGGLKDLIMPGQGGSMKAPGIATKAGGQAKAPPAGFNPFSGEPHKKAQEAPKKPMIVEIKDKPEVISGAVDHSKGILAIVLTMEKEDSAADIDLDVSSSELKLKSEHYELNYTFEQKVDEDAGIKAKFNKKKHILTLTLTLAK